MRDSMQQPNGHSSSGTPQLSRSQYQNVTECLSYLAQKLRVTALILMNSSGQVCAKKVSEQWHADTTVLTALTASSFSATVEIARLVGEKSHFKMVLHEGEKLNVYLSSITPNYFLMVVFEKGVALGMVRLFTKRTIEQLIPVLKQSENQDARTNQIFNKQFQSLLDEELDQMFNDKT